MSDVQKLLDEISHLVDVDKKLKEEKRVRGEMFNIFSVLGLASDEVRLHSTFLATLLNPKADHGQGEGFLKAFAERLDFPLDYASTKVEVEKGIGLVKDDHGGRIDILVSDNQKHGIIIENKIYAGDQPKQLTRYWNDAQKRFGAGNYCLVYLTLNGDEPSKDSTAGMPKKNKDEHAEYICLSYKDDILPWLEQCVALSVRQPLIRETLNQYIGVVRQLTYCDMENKNELLEKMTEHLDAVFTVRQNIDAMINDVMNNRLRPQLEELAQERGMTLIFPREGTDWMSTPYLGWNFRFHEWKYFDIRMEFEGKALKDLLIGFWTRENLRSADISCWKELQERTETADRKNVRWIYQWFNERRFWYNLDAMKEIMDGQTMKKLIEKKLDKFRSYAAGLDI